MFQGLNQEEKKEKPISILEEEVGPSPGDRTSVVSSLDIVFRHLGQGAQTLPAQGGQEHDKRQVDGGVVASGDQLAAGKTLCPDPRDDLPCFIRTWV